MVEVGVMVFVIDVDGLTAEQVGVSDDDFSQFLSIYENESAIVIDTDDDGQIVTIAYKDGLVASGLSSDRMITVAEYKLQQNRQYEETPPDDEECLESSPLLNTVPFSREQTIVTDEFTITEDGQGVVHVNGYQLHGFVDSGQCELCGRTIRIYDVGYDKYFCPYCNVWTEDWCSDPTCKYCSTYHPPRPLPTFGVNDDTFPKRSGLGWVNIKFIKIDV